MLGLGKAGSSRPELLGKRPCQGTSKDMDNRQLPVPPPQSHGPLATYGVEHTDSGSLSSAALV